MNYERDMSIDTEALDVEWVEQAPLAMRYGKIWADKKEELERANENVKLVKAELTVKINDDPEKYLGVGVKSTVANVEACILKHEDYQAARDEALNAMKEFNLIDIAKNEIAFTRKAALENLVVLHGQQYFAGPKIPRNLKEELANHRKQREFQKEKNNQRVQIRKRRKE